MHCYESQPQPVARFCTSYHRVGSDLAFLNEKMELGRVSRILRFFCLDEKSAEANILHYRYILTPVSAPKYVHVH